MWTIAVMVAAVQAALVWPEDSQWRMCKNALHCVITSYEEAAQDWNTITHFGDALQRFGNMLQCLSSLPTDCSPLIAVVPWDPYAPTSLVASKLEQLQVSSSMGIITMDSEELKEELVSPWDPQCLGDAKQCFQDVVSTLEVCRELAREEVANERLTVEETKRLLDSLRTVATNCKALSS